MRRMKLLRILYANRPTPPHKHTVQFGDAERQTLRRLITTGSAPARTLSRARILLKADASADGPACTDEQIRDALDVSLATIMRVRRAFATGGLDVALQRKPTRRQYRRALDGRQEAHLVTLACSTPPQGHARWSLRLLTDRFIELEGTIVSDETVRRVLKKSAQAVAEAAILRSASAQRHVRGGDAGRAGCV
jgi:transposase